MMNVLDILRFLTITVTSTCTEQWKNKNKTEVALLGWIDVKAVTEFGHFKLKSDCTN